MTDVTLVGERRELRRSGAAPIVATSAMLVGSAVVVVRSATVAGVPAERAPGFGVVAGVLAISAAGVGLAALAAGRLWRDGRWWASACAFAMVLLASGFGRAAHADPIPRWIADEQGGGAWVFAPGTLDVWWPVIGIGLAVAFGAVLHAVVNPGRPDPSPLRALGRRLVGVAIGGFALYWLVVDGLGRPFVTGSGATLGRPIRRRGRRSWQPGRAEQPSSVAGLWHGAAVDEAESVTSFLELGERLAAVSAPAELVARCGRSARDEERHARVCVRLAELHGDSRRPVPVAPLCAARLPRTPIGREIEVVRLAVESFVDGVLGEAWSADLLEAGASPGGPGARLQRSLVVDERRHTALGADIVRWCVERSPRSVVPALRRAALKSPTAAPKRPETDAFDSDQLEAVGWVDDVTAEALWASRREQAMAWLDSVIATTSTPAV